MKKLLQIPLLLVALLLSSIPIFAHDFEVDGIYYRFLDKENNTVSVTYKGDLYSSYVEYEGDIDIPDSVTYNGTVYHVTRIGVSAFRDTPITSVTIPKSIQMIDIFSFYGSQNLTTLNFNAINAANYKNASHDAGFYPNSNIGWTSIKELNIGDSVTTIAPRMFRCCESLANVSIGASLDSIGSGAFYQCRSLQNYNVSPDNDALSSIDGVLFNKAQNRLITFPSGRRGRYVVPDGVDSIANTAFMGNDRLYSIVFPNTLTTIGDSAFCKCKNLSDIKFSESLNSIGIYAFAECDALTTIDLPNSLTTMGDCSFYNCSNLNEVYLSNSLGEIPGELFYSCKNLESVYIPNSVTKIGRRAFNSTKIVSISIPNSVIELGGESFNSTPLESIIIPNSVVITEEIERCKNLKRVTFGKNMTYFGKTIWDFERCENITTLICLNSTPATRPNPQSTGYDVFDDLDKTTTMVYVPKGAKEAYRNHPTWKNFTNIYEIEVLAESISLDKTEISLQSGDSCSLIPTILPAEATIKDNIYWESDNPRVATVNDKGIVIGKQQGTCKIYATPYDGSVTEPAVCTVTVTENDDVVLAQSIEITPSKVYVGTKTRGPISFKVLPENATNKNVIFVPSGYNSEVLAYEKIGSGSTEGPLRLGDIITEDSGILFYWHVWNPVDYTFNDEYWFKSADGSDVWASFVITNADDPNSTETKGVNLSVDRVTNEEESAVEVARYDIHGRLLSRPTRGINIIRMSNGSVRKEFVTK